MKKTYDPHTLPLPLVGGVVQAQRLVVPPQVVASIKSYRHACRLAWKLRATRLTQLPAKHVGTVCLVLGNAVIAQWLAHTARVTLLEEWQATRLHGKAA